MSSTLSGTCNLPQGGWHIPHTLPLLAVGGGDGFHPQWEGFVISHKGQGLSTGLEPFKCGKETPRFGSWLGQSWCRYPASLLGKG